MISTNFYRKLLTVLVLSALLLPSIYAQTQYKSIDNLNISERDEIFELPFTNNTTKNSLIFHLVENGWVYEKFNIVDSTLTYGFLEYFDIYQNGNINESMVYLRTAEGKSPRIYYTNVYNNELRISSLQQRFGVNMQRINEFLNTYTYDENGKIIELRTFIYLDGITTQEYRKVTYNYNQNGLLSELTIYMNQGHIGWVQTTLYTYEYYPNNLVYKRNQFAWNGTSWDQNRRITYTYDLNDNLIVYYEEMKSQGNWQNFRLIELFYNNMNKRILENYFYYVNNDWVIDSKNEYSYDDAGNISMINTFWWENEWKLKYFKVYINGTESHLMSISPVEKSIIIPGNSVYLDWINYDVSSVNIWFSYNGGLNWELIESNISSPYLWTIPLIESEHCYIKYESSQNPAVFSMNELPFSIMEVFHTLMHTTDNIQVNAFNNGLIGRDNSLGIGIGFRYKNNANALFSGGFVIGDHIRGIAGMLQSFMISDFSSNYLMRNFTSNDYFDKITHSELNDFSSSNPFYVSIKQNTYSKLTDDFVFFKYSVKNEGGFPLDDLYLGIHIDWDIGTYLNNHGGYDLERNLIYQYEFDFSNDSSYYGVIALDGMAGGSVTGWGGSRLQLFYHLISTNYSQIFLTDNRTFISTGPFNVFPDNTVSAVFALVAGSSLNQLQVNADLAKNVYLSGVVSVDKEEISPNIFSLSQNYPNPFNPTTRIDYRLPENADVKIELYSITGEMVSRLVSGFHTAGYHSVEVNAGILNLSSGVYLYRIITTDVNGKILSDTKKMILMK